MPLSTAAAPSTSSSRAAGVACGVAVSNAGICWANAQTGTIGRANLDGTAPNQSLVTGASSPCGVALSPPGVAGPTPEPAPSTLPSRGPTPLPGPFSERIAFVRSYPLGEIWVMDGGQIWVMNADGSNQTRLTNNQGAKSSPVWSPDGELIARAPGQGSRGGAAGRPGASRRAPVAEESAVQPDWSPDGRTLAFVTVGTGLGLGVARQPFAGPRRGCRPPIPSLRPSQTGGPAAWCSGACRS